MCIVPCSLQGYQFSTSWVFLIVSILGFGFFVVVVLCFGFFSNSKEERLIHFGGGDNIKMLIQND